MKITAEQLEELTGLECASDVADALRGMGIETDAPAPYVAPTIRMNELMREIMLSDVTRRTLVDRVAQHNPLLAELRRKPPIPRSLREGVTRDNELWKLLKKNR